MDRNKAKELLEDWTLILKGTEMDTKIALEKRNYLEAQTCYDSARAVLAGEKTTFSALEIFSDKEMDAIYKNALKNRGTSDGFISDQTGKVQIAWKAFFFPVLQWFKIFFYFWLGTGIGTLLYTYFR